VKWLDVAPASINLPSDNQSCTWRYEGLHYRNAIPFFAPVFRGLWSSILHDFKENIGAEILRIEMNHFRPNSDKGKPNGGQKTASIRFGPVIFTGKFEKQSTTIDLCVTSADSMGVEGLKMILKAIGDILAYLSASPPRSHSITTEPEHHNWKFQHHMLSHSDFPYYHLTAQIYEDLDRLRALSKSCGTSALYSPFDCDRHFSIRGIWFPNQQCLKLFRNNWENSK
jgi:hypothetical protein